MAATSKSELLELTRSEHAKLKNLIAGIGPNRALRHEEDQPSIKDVVGHRAHWIELFLGWYADGTAGKDVYFPAKGYKWSDLKRYNADLRKKQSNLDWKAANVLFERMARALEIFIETKSEEELYGGPMPGARNNWTIGRWAEAAGASHYRSAGRFIRKSLKNEA